MQEMSKPVEPRPARPKPTADESRSKSTNSSAALRSAGAGSRAAAAPLPAEIVADDDAPVGGRVGQQVQTFLDTSEFGRRSEELGGEVAKSDQQFTKQVGQAFSGEVSRLASRPGEAAQPVEVIDVEVAGPEYLSRPTLDALPLAGSGLAELLGSPENIAQAVIMSEILRRPEF